MNTFSKMTQDEIDKFMDGLDLIVSDTHFVLPEACGTWVWDAE